MIESMRKRRTQTEHEVKKTEYPNVLIYRIAKPGTIVDSVTFINACGVMAVIGQNAHEEILGKELTSLRSKVEKAKEGLRNIFNHASTISQSVVPVQGKDALAHEIKDMVKETLTYLEENK